MTDLQIFLEVILRIIKNFILVVPVLIIGLAWLYVDERREKSEKA